MPTLHLGFSEEQINFLCLGAIDVLQTMLANGNIAEFHKLFWDWWVRTYGLPVPRGSPLPDSVDPYLGQAFLDSHTRLMAALRYYTGHPTLYTESHMNLPIVQERIHLLRLRVRNYRARIQAIQDMEAALLANHYETMSPLVPNNSVVDALANAIQSVDLGTSDEIMVTTE